MPSGIIVIDKPSDWTSMDVCAKLRGRFHEKRVGLSLIHIFIVIKVVLVRVGSRLRSF